MALWAERNREQGGQATAKAQTQAGTTVPKLLGAAYLFTFVMKRKNKPQTLNSDHCREQAGGPRGSPPATLHTSTLEVGASLPEAYGFVNPTSSAPHF